MAGTCVAVGNAEDAGLGTSAPLAAVLSKGRWKVSSEPHGVAPGAQLAGVSCPSATQCTAVGEDGGFTSTLAEAWNGSTWTPQATPNSTAEPDSVLDGVSCPLIAFCMAGGEATGSSSSGPVDVAFTEQWDGSTWTVEPFPQLAGATVENLGGLSCLSVTFCLAVGNWNDPATSTSGPLAAIWDGATWTLQTPRGTAVPGRAPRLRPPRGRRASR